MFSHTKIRPRWHHLLIFISPALILYTIFMIWPLMDSLRMSFYAPVVGQSDSYIFVGFDNYKQVLAFRDAPVQKALANTLKFIAIIMFVGNPLALLLASLLASTKLRWRQFYRTAIFIPTIMSVVIAGWVWQLMLNPLWGIINDILSTLWLESVIPPRGWLGTSGVALVVVALVATWQFIGLPTILFLATLVSIDDELIEAAQVDGASSWALFWKVKFPLILPEVGQVIILTIILNFPAFDITQVMGGRDTFLIANYFYYAYARNPLNASVISGIMFAIVASASLIYFFGFQRRLVRT